MRDTGQFRWVSAACLLLACLLAGSAVAVESVRLDPTLRPRIVNGLDTHAYPTAGAMLYSPTGAIATSGANLFCSGTLVGCETFVVAAHCVGDLDPTHYAVYLQHGGIVSVVSVTPHPSYTDADFPKHDVAVLKLGATVTGITPSQLAASQPGPLLPLSGTIVGFGQTQSGAGNYGLKRYGTVLAESCPNDLPAGATDFDAVCWNFSASPGPPGTDSNTCHGDSGGPLFLDLGLGPALAGVTSGGFTASCLGYDTGYDANVFTNSSFIYAQLGADSTDACGSLPPVGAPDTAVAQLDGTLDATNTSDTYTIAIPEGASELRVTLNGRDNGVFDPDLYVKAGDGAGPTSFDCAANGASAFAACVFAAPASGTWSIDVERYAGIGNYQLTATLFGASASCGNGVREFGEACDGGDAAECPGHCDACQCPQPCGAGPLTRIHPRVSATRFKVRAQLLNFDAAFTGADPRQGLTLALTQGAATATATIPANDPGWASSRPERGRYLWAGSSAGITKVKAIDRTSHNGTWKLIVIGQGVPGAGSFDPEQPIDVTLTMGADDQCASGTAQ